MNSLKTIASKACCLSGILSTRGQAMSNLLSLSTRGQAVSNLLSLSTRGQAVSNLLQQLSINTRTLEALDLEESDLPTINAKRSEADLRASEIQPV